MSGRPWVLQTRAKHSWYLLDGRRFSTIYAALKALQTEAPWTTRARQIRIIFLPLNGEKWPDTHYSQIVCERRIPRAEVT